MKPPIVRPSLLLALIITPSAAAQTLHIVEMMHIHFMPSELTIQLGDTVRWVWLEGFHNVESGVIQEGIGVHDGRFRSGDPDAGQTFELLFDRAFVEANPAEGEVYPYYCAVHSFEGMSGVIEVMLAGDADGDLDVDLIDHAHWNPCMAGPDNNTAPPLCSTVDFEVADLDADSDVDLLDFAELQNAFTG